MPAAQPITDRACTFAFASIPLAVRAQSWSWIYASWKQLPLLQRVAAGRAQPSTHPVAVDGAPANISAEPGPGAVLVRPESTKIKARASRCRTGSACTLRSLNTQPSRTALAYPLRTPTPCIPARWTLAFFTQGRWGMPTALFPTTPSTRGRMAASLGRVVARLRVTACG